MKTGWIVSVILGLAFPLCLVVPVAKTDGIGIIKLFSMVIASAQPRAAKLFGELLR